MGKIKKYKKRKVYGSPPPGKSSNIKLYGVLIFVCMVLSVGISYIVNKGSEKIDQAGELMSLVEKLSAQDSEVSEEIKKTGLMSSADISKITAENKEKAKKIADSMDDKKLEKLKKEYKDKLSPEEIEKLKQIYDK